MMRARFTTSIAAALVLAGCPRNEDTPPQNESSSGNAEATTNTSPPTTTVDPTSTTSVGTEETGPIDTSAGSSESTSGGEECLGPDGCWSCDPVQPEQVLNRCTDADCEPFDNSPKRLPLIGRDGELPPIP